jgi:hypothetical protein
MSEFVIPVVGQQYRLGDEVVEVVEALKKRYWRIRACVWITASADADRLASVITIPQSEWAAKAERVGS